MNKLTLYMTRGLPGSGKSTWAEQERERNPNLVIVNKDDIRKELIATGWKWSRENEKDVIVKRDGAILNALTSGKSVISSDTNFGKHEARLREIAAKHGAEFVIVDFTHVPVNVCIERDSRRTEGHVGKEVILKMAEQNGLLNPKYVPKEGTPYAIICDLDGTLAHKGNRSPFDYAKVGKDTLDENIRSILRMFHDYAGYQIIYCSGREDWCRDQTDDWLKTNGCPPGELFMRASGDHRNDAVVKRELFDAHIRDRYNVRFVLDDRDRVVKMWRELGLKCLQVAEGNF